MNAKKLLTLVLAMALVFTLAACSFTGGDKMETNKDSMHSGMTESKSMDEKPTDGMDDCMCGDDSKCMTDGMCSEGCMCMKDGMCTDKCMCMDGGCMKDGMCMDDCMCGKTDMNGKDMDNG